MSGEFSKLCGRLAIATAVAVLTPLATAVILGGTQAATDAGQADTATPPHQQASLDTLGRANAVAWIGSGHLARP